MKTTIFFITLITSAVLSVASYGQSTVLIPGKTIERKMLKGENHLYTISLKKGEYAACVVMQKGVDLLIDVIDPSGGKMETFDSPNGTEGPEPISIEERQAGKYELKIYPISYDYVKSDSIRLVMEEENQGDYAITGFVKLSVKENQKRLAKIQEDKAVFQQWINNNANELKTVDAGNGLEDLQPLKSVLKDVKVVGLGEATHGASEFFRMKHRMLEFLVKEMDFTSFYIEASMSRCRYINDYVLYGIGDIDTATAIHGFYVWRVEEVKNMIEWMRQYNTTVPDERKVKFFGYDIQINNLGWKGLKDFYTKVNAQKLIELDSLQMQAEQARQLVDSAFISGNKNEGFALLKDALPKVLAVMNDIVLNEGKYKFLTNETEYDENLMNIKLIIEEIDSYKNLATANRLRDYYMAENILNLLSQEKPGTKAVLWAHNSHIGKTSTGGMGSNLAEVLKDKYYAIGFEFYSGSFQTKNYDKSLKLELMSIGIPPIESLPWYFDQAGKEKFFIDFRNTGSVKIKNFTLPYEMHNLGSMYGIQWPSTRPSPLTDFDGMIYIQETTGAKGLPEIIFK